MKSVSPDGGRLVDSIWFPKAHAEISGVGKLFQYLLDSGDPVRFGPLIHRRVRGLSEWDAIDHCFWWLTVL